MIPDIYLSLKNCFDRIHPRNKNSHTPSVTSVGEHKVEDEEEKRTSDEDAVKEKKEENVDVVWECTSIDCGSAEYQYAILVYHQRQENRYAYLRFHLIDSNQLQRKFCGTDGSVDNTTLPCLERHWSSLREVVEKCPDSHDSSPPTRSDDENAQAASAFSSSSSDLASSAAAQVASLSLSSSAQKKCKLPYGPGLARFQQVVCAIWTKGDGDDIPALGLFRPAMFLSIADYWGNAGSLMWHFYLKRWKGDNISQVRESDPKVQSRIAVLDEVIMKDVQYEQVYVEQRMQQGAIPNMSRSLRHGTIFNIFLRNDWISKVPEAWLHMFRLQSLRCAEFLNFSHAQVKAENDAYAQELRVVRPDIFSLVYPSQNK